MGAPGRRVSAAFQAAPLPAGDAVALFRLMYQRSQDAVLLTRTTGEFVAANANACRLFGASEAALCERSRHGGHLQFADAADPRLGALLRLRAEHGQAAGEVRMRRQDGGIFEAHVSSFLFLDEHGALSSILTVRDISALRTAERLQRESEARLEFALDAAGIGDWDMDLRSNVARRSLRHDRCFGYGEPVAAWGYDTFLAHVDPLDRERVDACYQRAMAGDGDYDVEFRVTWPDGSTHWLWSKGCFYFDDAGRPYRVAGIQVDVTERRATDDALRRSEERLRLVLQASNDAPWDLDLASGAAYYSPRWLQMVGFAPDHPTGGRRGFGVQRLHPDDADRVTRAFQAALDGGAETYEIECRLLHADGHVVPVLSRGFVLRAADGSALRVSGLDTDLTERYRLREAERRQTVAEAANAAKTEFLARMSHELRTPLNAVIGFAQLLGAPPAGATTAEGGIAPRRDHARHIEDAGWHLLKLVDDILDLSRVDAGRVVLEPDAVPVAALLAECRRLMAGEATARRATLDIEPLVPALALWADATRCRQIVLNLLSNAVKYGGDGVQVRLRASVAADERVELSVDDNGPGLDAEKTAQLFQPFNRLGQEGGSLPGTGIGLVISRRLAEAMGGSLDARSMPGQGSSFTLRLPLARRPAAAPEPDSAPAVVPPPLRRSRVLYVEDNRVNIELMRAFVQRRPQVDLEVCELGGTALAMALAAPPDLLLLDLNLPDMPGLQVLRRLRASAATAALPIVVVSAAAMPDVVAEARAAGADDYLFKPLSLVQFLAVFDTQLARRA